MRFKGTSIFFSSRLFVTCYSPLLVCGDSKNDFSLATETKNWDSLAAVIDKISASPLASCAHAFCGSEELHIKRAELLSLFSYFNLPKLSNDLVFHCGEKTDDLVICLIQCLEMRPGFFF